jgi:very-short-patch-repair endonuclease
MFWRLLRNRSFGGHKFRRQHPLGRYVLDFYCPTLKLAIELDGSGHGYPSTTTDDRERDHFLRTQGIFVRRFWNHQIREELDSVRETIWLLIEQRKETHPSPQSSPLKRARLIRSQ